MSANSARRHSQKATNKFHKSTFKFPKIIVYECRKILLMVLVLTMVYWRAKSAKKAARLADLLCSALWVPKA